MGIIIDNTGKTFACLALCLKFVGMMDLFSNVNQDNQAMAKLLGTFPNSMIFKIGVFQKMVFKWVNLELNKAQVPIQIEQYPLLKLVLENDGQSQQYFADLLCIDRAAVKRSLATLLKRGLVSIKPNELDRRENCVSLTIAGKFIEKQLEVIIQQIDQELVAVVNNTHKSSQLMSAMTDVINQMHAKL